MNNINAIVGLDLDGTLLDENRKISKHTIEIMELVSKQGIQLVIDSGRRFPVVPEEIRDLSFMRYYVLCNGAEIFDKAEGKVIYRSEIPFSKALELYDCMIDYPQVYLDCYMSDGSWVRKEDYLKIDDFVKDPSHREVLKRTREPIENFRAELIRRGKPVYKFQTIYHNTEERNRERDRLKMLFPDINFTEAYSYNLEANTPDATKGGGLIKLSEILGVANENVYAFGDGGNDISMIELAGIGYAMENAPEEIKEKADRIAPRNTEEGVARVLEELFL